MNLKRQVSNTDHWVRQIHSNGFCKTRMQKISKHAKYFLSGYLISLSRKMCHKVQAIKSMTKMKCIVVNKTSSVNTSLLWYFWNSVEPWKATPLKKRRKNDGSPRERIVMCVSLAVVQHQTCSHKSSSIVLTFGTAQVRKLKKSNKSNYFFTLPGKN